MEVNAGVHRRVLGHLEEDLLEKMVLLNGPRQCGKTTLAKRIVEKHGGGYFNYDVASHRAALRAERFPDAKYWVFDEIHKLRSWRNWLKGVFDLHGGKHRILVTGSARLEEYRRGGDSLQGRYFRHRLHPLTVGELMGNRLADDPDSWMIESTRSSVPADDIVRSLMTLGGFPEPFFKGSQRWAERWRLAYGTLLVREEVRDLEQLRDLDRVELLFDRLPDVVGSVLSINALREDLEVAFETVRNWLNIFERLYGVFRVSPFGPPKIKAVKKESKLYLWDWARASKDAARFENLVLFHLLRLVHFLEDIHGEKAELRYFRDVTGREVDAIVLRKGKPWLAVECKMSDQPLDPSLRYLLERTNIPWAFQVSFNGTDDRELVKIGTSKVRLMPAAKFLAGLP